MKISIVVCTHNRRQWLLECIESYYRMNSVDSIENELLVIDNHSKDDTAQCIENLNTKFKNRIKYFFVAELGVSRARNAGIENASGDYIAFVDDDCLFEAHWLENMVVGLNSYPHIRAFGGKIVTQFEQPTPEWLTPSRLRHFRYGATNFGNFERDLVAPEYPPGSNMVFRKDLLSPDFRFSTELGRKGNSLLSNEEKEIFARLQNQGEKIMYLPRMEIKHRVDRNKMTRWWLFKRFYWQGCSEIKMKIELGSLKKTDWSEALVKSVIDLGVLIFGKSKHPVRLVKNIFSVKLEDVLMRSWALGSLRQLLISRIRWPEATDDRG